jgi:predicted nucleotide-binding protein
VWFQLVSGGSSIVRSVSESDQAGDLLAQLNISDNLRAIIARTAQEFELDGEWVSFDKLAYESATKEPAFNLNEIFKIPSFLGGSWADEKVSLTGLGLLFAGTAPKAAQMMAKLAEICSQRWLDSPKEATISTEILISEYGFSEDDAGQAKALIEMMPGISGGGYTKDDKWVINLWRGAPDYRKVKDVSDLKNILEDKAQELLQMHQRAIGAAPIFSQSELLSSRLFHAPAMEETASEPETGNPSTVFVVHGRDLEARDAMWEFLLELGLHPLEWAELVASTGQGSPFIAEVLDKAFSEAQAIVVLMTPDDVVQLHPHLVKPGEQAFESKRSGQPRPNVLFEAGMAFGFNPRRTILVKVGNLRPVSDLQGRHVVEIGTEGTLKGLALRLQSAGCPVDMSREPWLNVERFAKLRAHSRRGTKLLKLRFVTRFLKSN